MAPQTTTRRADPDLWESLSEMVETAITTAGGLRNAAEWVSKNTSDPRNAAKPFSFAKHEYQIGILNDPHPILAIRKSVQIGASEASLRLALAICAKFANISAIYVLPSIRFATKFSMARCDPIIDASPRLKALADRDVSSNELKKIGSSFLYFTGAAQSSSAISIPARALLIDEYAWCDPQVVSVFTSRLGHQQESEKIIRYFSSPLHPRSDISALVEQGTMNEYMVYHDTCGQWVTVSPLENMIIPGFDDHISNLQVADLDDRRIDVDGAYIQCQFCRNPVSLANLADHTRRAWVPRYPSREIASYDANPLVLPELRTPAVLLRDLRLYRSTQRWTQFSLGQPAEAASDMITQGALDRCFMVAQQTPLSHSVSGAVIGCDVGKTSHIAIGKQVGGVLNVLWLETVRQTDDNATGNLLVERFYSYHAVQAILDAAPDFSVVKSTIGRLPYNQVWGAYFVRGRGKANLETWELDEKEGVIKIGRTRALDEFVEAFNKGLIKLPAGMSFENDIRQHLQRLKRITNLDAVGEETAQWVSSDSSDHWFFAILYCFIASKLVEESRTGVVPGMDLSRLVGRVRLNSSYDPSRLRAA